MKSLLKNCAVGIICLFFIGNAHSFQLDDLLSDPTAIKRNEIKRKDLVPCRYAREIISYKHRLSFLGYTVKEAVLRFNSTGMFESADITIDYTVSKDEWQKIGDIADDIHKKIESDLGKHKWESSFTFPNKRTLHLKCWNLGKFNVRTICHLANYNGCGEVSYISVRIQTGNLSYPVSDDIIMVQRSRKAKSIPYDGGKLLPVPMRTQLSDLGGCWFTTLARQLNFIGSEIMPLMLLVGVGGDEDGQINLIGKKYGFRYDTRTINDSSQARKNCIDFIEEYNRVAKTKNIPVIKTTKEKKKVAWTENINIIDLSVAKSIMPKLKCFNGKSYSNFRKFVIDSIDHGLPIGWSVVRHSGSGKHRRMIVGYNLSKDMIYYSDTWGKGDNLNKMHFISAYLISVWCQIVH